MDDAAILSGLDGRQRAAVTSPAQPLAVVAPAGSGKTRVLTARVAHRIASGDADPRHVLCVTFTRRAAGELRERLARLGLRDRIEAGTFHSIALGQLRSRWQAAGRIPPRVIGQPRAVLAELAPTLTRQQVGDLVTELGWARARLARPENYLDVVERHHRRVRLAPEIVTDTWRAYDEVKTRRHLVDFDDLLGACATAIESDPEFAAAQRWRFRHLFVDEFQDVNPLQFRLLEAWRGDRWDVFVVGDPHQSIYGWNGADPDLIGHLTRRWPALETVTLERTHRTTPEITAAAASVIKAAGLADRHPESTGATGPRPTIRAHADGVDEIVGVASAIRHRRAPDTPWSSFAVLARTQDLVTDLEHGLAGMGIPVAVRRPAGSDDEVEHDDDSPRSASLDDAVTLSTIHAAKGLEWPIVHIVGVEDGTLPLASARRRDQRDEEARLLYVAVTRAQREVTLHWSAARVVRGVRRVRERSPFLDGFEDALAALPEPAPGSATARVRGLRELVPAVTPPDRSIAALRAWRARRARAARTVPESLLDDAAIDALAARRPRSIDELAAMPGIGPARARRYGPELLGLLSTAPVSQDVS